MNYAEENAACGDKSNLNRREDCFQYLKSIRPCEATKNFLQRIVDYIYKLAVSVNIGSIIKGLEGSQILI